MKNILLCNDLMGIGGVETAILNQISAFVGKGHNVYVIAKKGEYSKRVEELGGVFIECEYLEENKIDFEKVNKIVNIIRKNNISEIHIHKYQCVPNTMLAAFITNVPYLAYEHTVWDTKEYYKWKYPIYKVLFPIYFNNAYKIICITPKTIELTKNEYDIEEEKYLVVHNGIDFNEYINTEIKGNNKSREIYIISRFSEEKKIPIIEGIEIFQEIFKNDNKAKLYIIGDGEKKEDIIQYLEQNNLKYSDSLDESPIIFLGKKTNIKDYLKKADLVLGVDRCILEAIAMKVPAIITGYDGIKGLVNKENINMALDENFSGDNLKSITKEECMKQLLKLEENKESIVNDNYNVAIEKLDCYKNYINIPDGTKINFNWVNLFSIIEGQVDLIEQQYVDIKGKYDWIQNIEKENEKIKIEKKQLYKENEELIAKSKIEKEELEEKQKNIIEEKNQIKKELEEVYNSKRWRIVERINKIFRGKK